MKKKKAGKPKERRKEKRLTYEEILKGLVESGPNIDAILLSSGVIPKWMKKGKRLFKEPMISR